MARRQNSNWLIQLPVMGKLIQVAVLLLIAQQSVSAQQITANELAGKKLFLQRCSICHMPAPLNFYNPELPTYGPKLEGFVRDAGTESAAKAIINNGTARMPGFQYGLSGLEVDQIVAYMKIFRMSDFIRPGAEVGGGPDVVIDPGQINALPGPPAAD